MSDWKKETVEGENHYVLGNIRVQPVIGHGYWKWFLEAPSESRTFHTLKQAKEYVNREYDFKVIRLGSIEIERLT